MWNEFYFFSLARTARRIAHAALLFHIHEDNSQRQHQQYKSSSNWPIETPYSRIYIYIYSTFTLSTNVCNIRLTLADGQQTNERITLCYVHREDVSMFCVWLCPQLVYNIISVIIRVGTKHAATANWWWPIVVWLSFHTVWCLFHSSQYSH